MGRLRARRVGREAGRSRLCEAGYLSPGLDHVVVTAAGEETPVGAGGDGPYSSSVAREDVERLAGPQVPDLELPVEAAAVEQPPFGTRGDGEHRPRMPGDGP